ncbi:hypothetical protein ACFL4W_02385 [Planctomycetota bacterium]
MNEEKKRNAAGIAFVLILMIVFANAAFCDSKWDFENPDSGSFTLASYVAGATIVYFIFYEVCIFAMAWHLFAVYAVFAVYLLLNYIIPDMAYSRLVPTTPFCQALDYKPFARWAFVVLAALCFCIWVAVRRIPKKHRDSRDGIGKIMSITWMSLGVVLFAAIVIFAYGNGEEVLLRDKCRINLRNIDLMLSGLGDKGADCPKTIDDLFESFLNRHEEEYNFQIPLDRRCSLDKKKYRYAITQKTLSLECEYHGFRETTPCTVKADPGRKPE